ncbi:MAG: Ig-like domain-containing protein, partial [Limisphaerales bacterium]
NDNKPPTVNLVNPTNGASFTAPINVLLQAQAADSDGTISRVYFSANTAMLGAATAADASGFYNFTWTNPAPGSYTLTEIAVDNFEARTTSGPVHVTINGVALPVVTVAAPDAEASEPGSNTGTFHVYRSGSTNDPLTVFYRMSGTASNGIDYVSLPGTVTIPAGTNYAPIILQPIDDSLIEGTETAILTAISSPLGAPTTYLVGSPASATVSILDNDTNKTPVVSIVNPTNGASFNAPVNVLLQAQASDSDGSIFRVYFFAGNSVIGGTASQSVLDTNGLYDLTWTNPPPGIYSLTAVAIDNLQSHATSSPVVVTIIGPPPTNAPPSVHIYTPANNSSFIAPANIFIAAEATDKDGYVATVEFFENGTSLGVKTNNPASGSSINPFYIYWTNVPTGAADLTALATDNKGATMLSAAVHVTVVPPPPPPTNYPPTVRISSPANGASYHMPVNIPIYVYAVDPDGSVASVEVFAGTNDLGAAQRPCFLTPSPGAECPSNYFTLVWSNAPLGTYPITAVGTDNVGATTTSEPVKVTILPPPPPPSNHPPVVSIVATDPIAIEGTNCWTWVAPTNRTATWSNWYAGSALPCALVTNCGPKSATFLVRRDGSTNDSLTVNYEIGGTATNGVQYMTLPGSVTIPAGEHGALITVVPIDDGPPEINMTAILKIKLSTNYVIGLQQRAAAYILDGPQIRPASEITTDRCFHLKADGPDGAWFHIDYTTDLTTWTSLCTNQVVNGSIDFIDPDAQGDQLRYYRAVPQDTAPTQ